MKTVNVRIGLLMVWAMVAVSLWLLDLYDLIRHWSDYTAGGVAATMIMILRSTVIIVGFLIVYRVTRKILKDDTILSRAESSGWFSIRTGLYCFLPALFIPTLLHMTRVNSLPNNTFIFQSVFFSALSTGWLIWLYRMFGRSRLITSSKNRTPFVHILDIACMNILVLLILGETLLAVSNQVNPSLLLQSKNPDVAHRVKKMRWKPGALYLNFHLNSGGYHDEEFFIAGDSDLVIGFLGDSFGVGIVPYEFNFVTRAEQKLREIFSGSFDRIAIHNTSIPGIAMDEYAYLLESDILPFNPSIVVLCLFIGNDIIESAGFGRTDTKWYCFQNWYLYQFPRRAFVFVEEYDTLPKNPANQILLDKNLLKRAGTIPDHIYDASKEPPYFSEDTFLRIEKMRFEVCNPSNYMIEMGFEGVFAGLRYFQHVVKDRLLVILLPDEFQVNDELYRQILDTSTDYAHYQWDYPQQKIAAFCREQAIRCADMLPVLREGQKQGRTYHLRDTHLNAFGNSLVGAALADELTRVLVERGVNPQSQEAFRTNSSETLVSGNS
jgi:hypothetical protein